MMRSVRKEITIAHTVVMSGGNGGKGECYRPLKARARVNTRVGHHEYHVTQGSNAKAAREMYKVTLLCRLLYLPVASDFLSLTHPPYLKSIPAITYNARCYLYLCRPFSSPLPPIFSRLMAAPPMTLLRSPSTSPSLPFTRCRKL